MKAQAIPYGMLYQVEPKVWAERATPRFYRQCWGKVLDPNYVAFFANASNNKLYWWGVKADKEVNWVGSAKNLGNNI